MTGESKHDRFRRVAQARTRKTLAMLALLGNCSRTNTYAYTDDEVQQIFDAIDVEIARIKELYRHSNEPVKRFTLAE